MGRPVLIIEEDAEYFRERLGALFPQLDIRTALDRAEVGNKAADAEVIMGRGTSVVFDAELVSGARHLQWVQALTSGTDAILATCAIRPEVIVTSMRGIHGPQVAEMAFLQMLVLARDYPQTLRNQERALWQFWPQRLLLGKTIAILGIGIIAGELASRCKAFGMTVLGITSTLRPVAGFDRMFDRGGLREAAALADFLVVLVPHTSDTDHIVDAGVIGAMKSTAFLVNLARGGVVDEGALLAALRERRIAGAGLDVFQTEPLPIDHPFWRMPNVVITPHCAGSNENIAQQKAVILEQNLRCFLEGRQQDMVNIVPR
ncbi:MAG: hypothetical protein A3I00_00910 [Betaproteobacteria bacterium RIFCSPLOWO2_02_FULL_64_12]|nr:MAG: hypothetical protein A3I00_00910 [Betaproteobacteria bacterium RIFCSPLOWO2_02_FULL_64_12]